MTPFLEALAKEIIGQHNRQLQHVLVVLPSRRATVFLKSALQQQLIESQWLPLCIAYEDFVHQATGLEQAAHLELVLELYHIHQSLRKKEAEPLDTFIHWAPMLISDYNEVDAGLVEPKKFFTYLHDIKRIELWNPDGQAPTDYQLNYLKFWEDVGTMYAHFSERLLSIGRTYNGLAARVFNEAFDDFWSAFRKKHQINSVYLAGFNALSASQEALFDKLAQADKVVFQWDADDYYLNNEQHEAGHFLRKHFKKRKNTFQIETNFKKAKQIDVIAVNGSVAQAIALQQVLEGGMLPNKEEELGIVLADEELLIPALEYFPQSINAVNVTMGYPLKHSSAFQFTTAFIKLYKNARSVNGVVQSFYHSDVEQLLLSPVLQQYKALKQPFRKVLQAIKKRNYIYVSRSWLVEALQSEEAPRQVVDRFNRASTDVDALLLALREWVVWFVDNGLSEEKTTPNLLNREAWIKIGQVIGQLERLFSGLEFGIEITTLQRFFLQLVGTESIPFRGEPLSGAQVMGMLETRLLDFKQIVMLSVNEGVLPKGKKPNSFIPLDMRKAFGLPTYSDKDAVFSYHFYRLLQRAEHIVLLYDESSNGMGKGEPGRFILQLKEELKAYQADHELRFHQYRFKVPTDNLPRTEIEKQPNMVGAIREFFERGISPSALNLYLSSPLDFYYQYLLQLRDQKQVEEQMEDSTFGSILHDVLEALYKPLQSSELNASVIETLKNQVHDEVHVQYKRHYGDGYRQGELWLTCQVAIRMIHSFLRFDAERCQKAKDTGSPITLVALESKMNRTIQLAGEHVNIKGKIDRIERQGDEVWVIDYKSGDVKTRDMTGNSVEELLEGKKPKAVQALLYQYIVSISYEDYKTKAAMISLRNVNAGMQPLKLTAIEEEDAALECINKLVTELTSFDGAFQRPEEYPFPFV